MGTINVVFFHPNREACDFVAMVIRHNKAMSVKPGAVEEIAG